MARALILALTLMTSTAVGAPALAAATQHAATPATADALADPTQDQGEPLPPGAPTEPYLLTGWCYGALAEYLQIYDTVKPDLIAIDAMFGTPVKETEPYHSDIVAYRDELKIFASAIVSTEKASPQVISGQGAEAIRAGQSIWRQAEMRTHRELARAWMSWGMPDRCDTNAKALLARSTVLGKALSYNNSAGDQPAPTQSPTAQADAGPGALTLAPIAPIVTRNAAVSDSGPKSGVRKPAGGANVASAEPPPMSSLPPGGGPISPSNEPSPASGADVAAATPPSRVIEDAPMSATAAAPAASPAVSASEPTSQEPAMAAPTSSPEPTAAPTPAAPVTTTAHSEDSQEPVL